LKGIAYDFFQSADLSAGHSSDEILRGLRDADPTVNIIEQIILSGIFNLVDKRHEIDYFDFPHRRFRETLAVSYFNNEAGVEALIPHLREPEYSELILVYIRQSCFKRPLLNAMIAQITSKDSFPLGLLFSSALAELPKADAHSFLCDLLAAIDPGHVPELPSGLVALFILSDDSRRLILESVRSAITRRSDGLLALWLRIATQVHIDFPTSFVPVADLTFLQTRIFLYEGIGSISSIEDMLLERLVVTGVAGGIQHNSLVEDLYRVLCGGKNVSKRTEGFVKLRRLRGRLKRLDDARYKGIYERISKMVNAFESNEVWEAGTFRLPPPYSPWRVAEV
jgi:hypothetical protein